MGAGETVLALMIPIIVLLLLFLFYEYIQNQQQAATLSNVVAQNALTNTTLLQQLNMEQQLGDETFATEAEALAFEQDQMDSADFGE